MTLEQFKKDFEEALQLLRVSSPNSLLIDQKEYWDRYSELMDRYFPDEDEDEDDE